MSVIDDAPRARRCEASFAGSVAILAWPAEAEEAAECGRTGQPRLLLVASDAEPPTDWDGLTDWGVVTRHEVGAAAWPGGSPGTRAVDGRLRRLRDRVEPLGIQIHNVRRRGLMLEVFELSA